MPAKMPRQSDVNGGSMGSRNGYGYRAHALDNGRLDDTGSGAESRTRKRLQKSVSEAAYPVRPANLPEQTANLGDMQANTASRRRQSVKDPSIFAGGQRVVSGGLPRRTQPSEPFDMGSITTPSTPSIRPSIHNRQPSTNTRSQIALPTAIQNSTRHDSKPSNLLNTRFDFEGSLDSTNADDHALGYTANISAGGDAFTTPVIRQNTKTGGAFAGAKKPLTVPKTEGAQLSRASSLVSRHNSIGRAKDQQEMAGESMGPPATPSATRTRRQSQFQMARPTQPVARTPRKSMGPGVLPGAMRINNTSVNLAKPPFEAGADGEGDFGASSVVDTGFQLGFRPPEQASFVPSPRTAKAKSFQPTSKGPHAYLSAPFLDFQASLTTGLGSNGSPAIEKRTTTPSSGKRLSIAPGHATGLGARTISPTDARRLKRLSMMPNPPPMPFTPPATQADGPSYFGLRSTANSPSSLIPRKTSTPSSNRTTPDHGRKSFSSGVVSSSNTSYASNRTSNGSIRNVPGLSHSRLPTVKSRAESVAAAYEAEVPPVPAIPKAYESPKGDFDIPIYATRKSSLPFDATSLNSTSNSDTVSTYSSEKEPSKAERDTRQRAAAANEAVYQNTKAPASRNLQPLRLPPINLLPLSTPTANKIAALHDNKSTYQLGAVTPPPRKAPPKTPSTPMTASKASFFPRAFHREEVSTINFNPPLRSNSSHYALRSEVSSMRAPSTTSSIAWGPSEPQLSRKAVSPFLSSSLPKTSLDLGAPPKTPSIIDNSKSSISLSRKPSMLTGPREPSKPWSHPSPKHAAQGKPPTPEPEPAPAATGFGASLRRTLSLNRRKSVSRANTAVDQVNNAPQPPKHGEMPPPKLPASGTWTNGMSMGKTPTSKSQFLPSRRKTSISDMPAKIESATAETMASAINRKPVKSSSEYKLSNKPTENYVEALPASALKSLGLSEPKRPRLQRIEATLDTDDKFAEEEMRKLALQRRDTESAARELDELRRRAVPKDRVSPTQALRTAKLNIFERGEIIDYKDVYFCGTQGAKKLKGDLGQSEANFGYDDERGDYNIVDGDHVMYRYEVVDLLGKGSFGQVVRCVDHKTGGLVAIKIIRNKKRFHQQALVEVNILQKIREWDPSNEFSMVSFTQSFYFRGHLCISTELLGMNLYEFIKLHNYTGFSLPLVRRFTKQILNCLVMLKSKRVIHCDLKPENILLAHPARSEIKVIDFGSSCLENEKVYTYIQSRFYRSPEVILGMTYGLPIDMWSLGCILAELLTGYPIFPGENEQEQLACIMEIFGPPDKHLIEKSTRKKLFFDSLGKPRPVVSSKGKRRRPSSKTLSQALKCDDDVFLDFIARCLRWDPDRRLKPDEAIHHEFITKMKPATPARHNLRNTSYASAKSASSSPIKRFNSHHAPAPTTNTTAATSSTTTQGPIRPLPEPPATTMKINGGRNADVQAPSGASPVRPTPKRHSTVSAVAATTGYAQRKAAAQAGQGSSLPRLGGGARNASGNPAPGRGDVATQAAQAAQASMAVR